MERAGKYIQGQQLKVDEMESARLQREQENREKLERLEEMKEEE